MTKTKVRIARLEWDFDPTIIIPDCTSASDNSEEPVQVTNKYDSTQLKNAIDDEVRRVSRSLLYDAYVYIYLMFLFYSI